MLPGGYLFTGLAPHRSDTRDVAWCGPPLRPRIGATLDDDISGRDSPRRGVSVWDDAHETLHLDLRPHTDALDGETRGGFPN